MDSFEYFRTRNVKEACALLSQYGEEAKILAGGQSLVTLMKQKLVSPTYIIDIKGIPELDYIRYDEADGLRIGALATHRSLEKSEIVKDKFFILAEMESSLASVPVRNWGTVVGNLCHGDPASDVAPALIALGADATLTGKEGSRVVPVEDFFTDYFETAVRPEEIVTEIHVPPVREGEGCYYKFAHRATDLAAVGMAIHVIMDPVDRELCKDIRIVMGSVGPTPLRSKRAEDFLRGERLDEKRIEEAARLSSEDAEPTTDINGSEDYKREIIKVLVRRTIKDAAVRAAQQ